MTELAVHDTAIPGLLVVDLDVRGDNRGWFKENWQRAKMTALGLPDFGPVQNNVSFNAAAGVTRGIHAEPWDKLVSVATGRIFGAWVDLRPGAPSESVVTLEIGPDTAVFVPRGVGNAFQTLEDGTAYSYLVNDHWSPAAKDSYTFVNLADETLAIDWPIPLDQGRAVRGRPRSPAARRGGPDAAEGDPGRRCRRPARAGAPGRPAGRGGCRPGRARPRPTRHRSPPSTSRPTGWWSTRPPTPRSTPPRPPRGAERPGRRTSPGLARAGRGRPRAPVHAGARVARTTSSTAPPRCTARTSRSRRWGSTARPRPPATPWWRRCPGTTSSGPAG